MLLYTLTIVPTLVAFTSSFSNDPYNNLTTTRRYLKAKPDMIVKEL